MYICSCLVSKSGMAFFATLKENVWYKTTILQFTLITRIFALYNRIANGLGFAASESDLREAGKAISARSK